MTSAWKEGFTNQLAKHSNLENLEAAVWALKEASAYVSDDEYIEVLESCAEQIEEVIGNYDPTPEHQWEVTEGSSERERWETMIRNLPK